MSGGDTTNHSAGWFRVWNDAIARLPEVGMTAFVVYAVLLRHANANGQCFPSVARIASTINSHKATVLRAITTLETAEWISVERKRGTHNVYHVPPMTTGRTSATGEKTPVAPVQPTSRASATPTGRASATLRATQGTRPNKGDKARRKTAAVVADIPSELDTKRFREAWGEWLAYRKASRKTLAPQTAKGQLKKLASWGERTAVEAIANSITQGWTGLFQPEEKNGRQNGKVGGTIRQTRSVARVGQRYGPK